MRLKLKNITKSDTKISGMESIKSAAVDYSTQKPIKKGWSEKKMFGVA